jgi:hypothetical protein
MDTYAYLFAAAVQLSGLPALPARSQPTVSPVTDARMRALACTDPKVHCDGLQAYFDRDRNTIYVRDYGPERGAEWESFIVHEYVHALQYAQRGSAIDASCVSRRAAEQQAYDVQDRYLRMRGSLLRLGWRLWWWHCEGEPARPLRLPEG